MNFTLTELCECAEREVRLRRQVYPARVSTGRMSQRWADRQIAMMTEIHELLRNLAGSSGDDEEQQRAQQDLFEGGTA